ncbi:MAG: DJ-1/PfpI family protein [Chitinophagaceae bacterium]
MHQNRKITFFVPSQVHVLDLNGPIQVFYEANEYGAHYDLTFCSLRPEVASSAGLYFSKLQHFSKIKLNAGDYLFLPGAGMEYLTSREFKNETLFLKWVKLNHDNGVNVCSVCTGSFIMAEAGLLKNKPATTHWKRVKELKLAYPEIQIKKDTLFTHDDGIYTSAGITSGIDLSLAIVEEHYGPLFAHKVSRELVVYYRRSGNHTQDSIYLNYRNHIQQEIHSVQDWLVENLDKKFTIAQLAEMVRMSPRNLTRAFKKAAGLTINGYVKKLRLEEIKILSHNTEMKSTTIAQRIGYSGTRQLRRIKKH